MKAETSLTLAKDSMKNVLHGIGSTENAYGFIDVFQNGHKEKKVFLGGTWNSSTWRDILTPLLKVDYFNPVVEDWNEETKAEEERQKDECGIHLYVITPKSIGSYSIAEAIDSAYKNPKGTYFAILTKDGDLEMDKKVFDSFYETGKKVVEITGNPDSFVILANNNRFKVLAETLNNIKRGFPNKVHFTVQSQPKKFGGTHGLQVYDIISYARLVLRELNREVSDPDNMKAYRMLNDVLTILDDRTKKRIVSKVEGYAKK